MFKIQKACMMQYYNATFSISYAFHLDQGMFCYQYYSYIWLPKICKPDNRIRVTCLGYLTIFFPEIMFKNLFPQRFLVKVLLNVVTFICALIICEGLNTTTSSRFHRNNRFLIIIFVFIKLYCYNLAHVHNL